MTKKKLILHGQVGMPFESFETPQGTIPVALGSTVHSFSAKTVLENINNNVNDTKNIKKIFFIILKIKINNMFTLSESKCALGRTRTHNNWFEASYDIHFTTRALFNYHT